MNAAQANEIYKTLRPNTDWTVDAFVTVGRGKKAHMHITHPTDGVYGINTLCGAAHNRNTGNSWVTKIREVEIADSTVCSTCLLIAHDRQEVAF
jgi:hypothetical protein